MNIDFYMGVRILSVIVFVLFVFFDKTKTGLFNRKIELYKKNQTEKLVPVFGSTFSD